MTLVFEEFRWSFWDTNPLVKNRDDRWFLSLQTARRSLSYSIFQPRRHEIPLYYSTTSAGNSSCSGASSGSAGGGQSGASAQVYMSKSVNEYGHPTLISVYRTPPLLTVYPRLQPPATTTPVSQAVRYSNSMSPSESSSSDALSLVTSELSATGISSPNSSPLNTSTSSQDNDEYFVYPNPTMPQAAANSIRSISYSSPHQGNMQLFPNSLILNQCKPYDLLALYFGFMAFRRFCFFLSCNLNASLLRRNVEREDQSWICNLIVCYSAKRLDVENRKGISCYCLNEMKSARFDRAVMFVE